MLLGRFVMRSRSSGIDALLGIIGLHKHCVQASISFKKFTIQDSLDSSILFLYLVYPTSVATNIHHQCEINNHLKALRFFCLRPPVLPVFIFAMYRPAARIALRSVQNPLAPARTAGRRCLTTEAPHLRSRSWKSSAVRWGIAAAAIYYYNTSPVFAEYPQNSKQQ